MKVRANLKLVSQLDYIPKHYSDIDGNKCLGCVFQATMQFDNSMCDRVNSNKLTCGADMIWIIDEEQWNNFKEKR